jgi:hypothetical protein
MMSREVDVCRRCVSRSRLEEQPKWWPFVLAAMLKWKGELPVVVVRRCGDLV